MLRLAIASATSAAAVALAATLVNFPAPVFAGETSVLWSSGPWTIEVVPDTFYGAGTGCKLSLDHGDHRASFTAFFLGGPVTVEGPELENVPKVGTLNFWDPKSGYEYRSFGGDDSESNDGKVVMRLPSQALMQAIEGFAELGTTSLVVSDADHSFKLTLNVTGLPEASKKMRNCVDAQGLGL